MSPRAFAAVLALAGPTALANPGTFTVLFTPDLPMRAQDAGHGLPALLEIGTGEIAAVTPAPGEPPCVPFLPRASQWAFLGDADGDGRYADSPTVPPGGDIDCVFVRRAVPSPSQILPRDVFVSRTGTSDLPPGAEDGDVFRFAHGGQSALATRDPDVDLDAICQSTTGDLFFSLATGVAGIGADQLLHVPAAAVTYDADGIVAAIAAGSASVVAGQVDLDAWVASSGFRTSTGDLPAPTNLSQLTALEIDPAGGSWTSSTGTVLPNLMFAWRQGNAGAIVSTRNGGELARVNGIQMGSALTTKGTHLGLLPHVLGVSGLQGLALVPAQDPILVVEGFPSDRHANSATQFTWRRLEVANAAPHAMVQLAVAVGPSTAGGHVASVPHWPHTYERFVGIGTSVAALFPTDAKGYGAHTVLDAPSPALPGTHVVVQAIDLSTNVASSPAAVQFQ